MNTLKMKNDRTDLCAYLDMLETVIGYYSFS